jgi:hypothetical protein
VNITQFNCCEAALWFAIGTGLLIASIKGTQKKHYANIFQAGSATFLIFSLTDIIEAHSGAWWRPFWLLLIKAA